MTSVLIRRLGSAYTYIHTHTCEDTGRKQPREASEETNPVDTWVLDPAIQQHREKRHFRCTSAVLSLRPEQASTPSSCSRKPERRPLSEVHILHPPSHPGKKSKFLQGQFNATSVENYWVSRTSSRNLGFFGGVGRGLSLEKFLASLP